MSQNTNVDALILTALQDELEAVLALGEKGKSGWSEERDAHGFVFHRRTLGSLSIAAAWTGQMGETAAAIRASELISELSPLCLAMCGICAGKRDDVFLGDVIVADRVYSYDHGKLVAEKAGQQGTLYQDIETYNLKQDWRVDAAYFARNQELQKQLRKGRPRSLASQQDWLLHVAYLHQLGGQTPPRTHPRRNTYCPAWPMVLSALEQRGLLLIEGSAVILTESGIRHVEEQITRDPDWPRNDPQFRIHVGPIATGKTVRKDPGLFSFLERSIRKTLGVEMEAAAIGYVTDRRGLKLLIAKAVSDYGDGDKDDSFRKFASNVSAKFVIAFLERHLPPRKLGDKAPKAEDSIKWKGTDDLAGPDDSADFSPSLIRQMELLHKHIRRLTEEQFSVIEFLHGHPRAAIQGCAGSGKTLVAAEKALRLSRAGLRTLLLCHNPDLASRLRVLTAGAGVEVIDFESWVQLLNGAPGAGVSEWMQYAEPSEAELNQAFEKLVAQPPLYDAVIVDEGQDFRETWWRLVEAGLKSPREGIMYVFLDDNQALLPHRGRPPVKPAPYRLSRNCRNSGAIFEIVRRLHPCAPGPSLALSDQGRVQRFPFEFESDARKTVAQAVSAALREIPCERLIVLTTESDPASLSVLEGLEVMRAHPWRWQDVVTRYLRRIVMAPPLRPAVGRSLMDLPNLSSEMEPTQDDVRAVNSYVQRVVGPLGEHHVKSIRVRWFVGEDGLELYGAARHSTHVQTFFGWTDWSQGFPANSKYKISSLASIDSRLGMPVIRLRTISAFKGLEEDGVVLYLRESTLGGGPKPDAPDRTAKAYVGVSRAHLLLYLVGHWHVLDQI